MSQKLDSALMASYTSERIHFLVLCSRLQMRPLVISLCWQMFLTMSIYTMNAPKSITVQP